MSHIIRLAGFLKWEAGDIDVRLNDGGTLVFNDESYVSRHPVFGAIAGFTAIDEGVGDQIPNGTLTFSPGPTADPYTINSPTLQGTRLRMWIGEVDRDTGLLDGEPEQVLDSIVDVTTLKFGRGKLALEVDIVARGERLVLINEGNTISGEFHRRIYPDERGLDNATGVPINVAWGVTGAPRGISAGGGSAFGSAASNARLQMAVAN